MGSSLQQSTDAGTARVSCRGHCLQPHAPDTLQGPVQAGAGAGAGLQDVKASQVDGVSES